MLLDQWLYCTSILIKQQPLKFNGWIEGERFIRYNKVNTDRSCENMTDAEKRQSYVRERKKYMQMQQKKRVELRRQAYVSAKALNQKIWS